MRKRLLNVWKWHLLHLTHSRKTSKLGDKEVRMLGWPLWSQLTLNPFLLMPDISKQSLSLSLIQPFTPCTPLLMFRMPQGEPTFGAGGREKRKASDWPVPADVGSTVRRIAHFEVSSGKGWMNSEGLWSGREMVRSHLGSHLERSGSGKGIGTENQTSGQKS